MNRVVHESLKKSTNGAICPYSKKVSYPPLNIFGCHYADLCRLSEQNQGAGVDTCHHMVKKQKFEWTFDEPKNTHFVYARTQHSLKLRRCVPMGLRLLKICSHIRV